MVKWIAKRKKKSEKKNEVVNAKVSQESCPDVRQGEEREASKPERKRAPAPDKKLPKQTETRKAATREEKPKSDQPWNLARFQVEAEEGKTRFHDLDLPIELMHAIADQGFQYCTPVQAETLPPILEGKNVAGQAQTGTGKTAAFLLGVFAHFLSKPLEKKPRNGTPRALVIAPTRELVVQLERDANSLAKYTKISTIAVYGGLDYAKQEKKLRNERVDIVAATPGRLIDYMGKKIVDLSQVEYLIIDEADRMLDMGFIPDVRRIIRATPNKSKRQTLLFSATLDEPVTRLSRSWMDDPARVEIDPENIAADSVEQKVYIVTDDKKYALLYNILKQEKPERSIIFANRRDTVDHLTRHLKAHGFKCNKLSGSVSQKRRMRTLDDFRAGKFDIMVATDVAGRGLHIEAISHIINYNVPQDPEDYVHRIGRTGRAGSLGISITFACEKESFYLPAIEELLGNELNYTQPEEQWLTDPPKVKMGRTGKSRKSGGKRPRGRNKRRR